MPLIPDSIFGIAYATGLLLACAVAWYRGASRSLIYVMVLHWVGMRIIDATDHTNNALWVAHDIAMVGAVLYFCRGLSSKAIAVLFFVLLQFDLYSLLHYGLRMPVDAFDTTASVGEAIGYLAMILLAGAKNADGGKLDRRSASRFGLGGAFGRGGAAGYLSSGRAISSRSGLSGASLGSDQATGA